MKIRHRDIVRLLVLGVVLEMLILLWIFWREGTEIASMLGAAPAYLASPVVAVLPFSWLMSWHRRAPSMETLILVGVSTIFVGRYLVEPKAILLLPFVVILMVSLGMMATRSSKVAAGLGLGVILLASVHWPIDFDPWAAGMSLVFAIVAITAGLLMALGVFVGLMVSGVGRLVCRIFRWTWPVGFVDLVRAGYGAVVLTIPVVAAAYGLSEYLAPWWPWQATVGTPLVLTTAFVLWRGGRADLARAGCPRR